MNITLENVFYDRHLSHNPINLILAIYIVYLILNCIIRRNLFFNKNDMANKHYLNINSNYLLNLTYEKSN